MRDGFDSVAEAKARQAISAGVPFGTKQLQLWAPADATVLQSSYQVTQPVVTLAR